MEYYNRTFITYKMCPPNTRVRYFFSNPTIPLMKVHDQQPKTKATPRDFEVILNYDGEQYFQCTVLDELNYCETPSKHHKSLFFTETGKVFNKAYTQQVNSRPRGHFRHNLGLNIDGQWTLENSIFFRNFQADTIALINECFEYDFTCSRIPKLSEERVDVVRETLRPFYIYIFTTYRAYAACNAPLFP